MGIVAEMWHKVLAVAGKLLSTAANLRTHFRAYTDEYPGKLLSIGSHNEVRHTGPSSDMTLTSQALHNFSTIAL